MELGKYLNGLQHIGLPCRNMEETIAFYENLGMHVAYQTVNEGQKVCFLQQGNLVIEAYEEAKTAEQTGAIDHICFDVSDIDKVFDLVRQMEERREEMGEIIRAAVAAQNAEVSC